MDFKFRFVRDGDTVGVLRSPRGRVGEEALELGDATIPYRDIGETVTRGDRVALQFTGGSVEGKAGRYVQDSVIVIEPRNVVPRRLEMLVDQRCAAVRLEERRRRARERGRAHLVRSEPCPTCSADIDLTGLEEGRYIYCPYCEIIFESESHRTLGRQYRICDECGLFGRVQQYPEFYFYFLLVVYGFRY